MSMPVVPGGGRAARLKRRKIKRIVLFASLGVIILLTITAAILLALEIAEAAGKLKPDDRQGADSTSSDIPTPPDSDIASGYSAFMYDSAKSSEGPLVLVNKSHKFIFPSSAAHMSDIRNSRNKNADGSYSYSCDYDKMLDSEALREFNSMMDAFYAETKNGYALVTAAYRTAEEQDALELETKGGYSDHHTGCLVAIKFYLDSIMYDSRDSKFSDAYSWLSSHAADYGFVVRYPDSKASATGVSNYSYAYRYVGRAHAAYMTQNNLCLEEYVELLKSHPYNGSHLAVTDSAGTQYEIYSIPASAGAQTSIHILDGKSYTISGDNDGGFIVAAKLN